MTTDNSQQVDHLIDQTSRIQVNFLPCTTIELNISLAPQFSYKSATINTAYSVAEDIKSTSNLLSLGNLLFSAQENRDFQFRKIVIF